MKPCAVSVHVSVPGGGGTACAGSSDHCRGVMLRVLTPGRPQPLAEAAVHENAPLPAQEFHGPTSYAVTWYASLTKLTWRVYVCPPIATSMRNQPGCPGGRTTRDGWAGAQLEGSTAFVSVSSVSQAPELRRATCAGAHGNGALSHEA